MRSLPLFFAFFATFSQSASASSITDLVVSGSGCSAGTAAIGGWSMTFWDYALRSGPGISLFDGRMSCDVTGTVWVPAGMQYTIPSFVIAGYAEIPQGEVGHHAVRVEFPSLSRRANKEIYLRGPMEESYAREIFADGILWSPCGTDSHSPFAIRITSTLAGLRRQEARLVVSELSFLGEVRMRPCPPNIRYP